MTQECHKHLWDKSSPGPAETNHVACGLVSAMGHKPPQSPFSCSAAGFLSRVLNAASFPAKWNCSVWCSYRAETVTRGGGSDRRNGERK